ncbi:MAG: SDR family NAD(P)-dependent oxidoreductase [Cyanobacteriota bacterium]|nr:SDR family NAD(P)-dependent oxidoreductase [Cyanobacteriota bacterium]
MASILITGGAGFIGTNAAIHFASRGWSVTILDNLSRRGTERNLSWLQQQRADITFHRADIRDFEALSEIVAATRPDMVLHLAAQVAVTSSYLDPREDFEINACGSFNLMEAVRLKAPQAFVLYASTNKVYGGMESVPVIRGEHGYGFEKLPFGVPEEQPLDFHSPYGCSKGVADQYTIDYARIYNLQTCSFRQSCIYGIRQFGIEDQGWVAWFSIAALLAKPITLYGDGWQTRDVLNVQDLARAYEAAWEHRATISGQAFNIGGGPANTLCLRDLLAFLEDELGITITPSFGATRPGDQPVFVCDIRKAQEQLRWTPQVGVEAGVRDLIRWVRDNREMFSELQG